MRILLDTHTFLWFTDSDTRLPGAVRAMIEDGDNEMFLSIATPWEVAIKISIGKLQLKWELAEVFSTRLEANAIELLPIRIEHLSAVSLLPRHHGDPFDRLIIAQAQVENLSIISADAAFDAYDAARLW